MELTTAQRPRAIPKVKLDPLVLDYQETFETFRQLVDIRFKLLGFVPTLTAVAVTLLTATAVPTETQLAVGVLGLLVTFGTVLYDQRNTQFHNGAHARLKYLEMELQLPTFEGDPSPGLIGSRGGHKDKHLLGMLIRHDSALALIYGAAVGAWTFVAAAAAVDFVGPGPAWIPASAGAAAGLVMYSELSRLNPPDPSR